MLTLFTKRQKPEPTPTNPLITKRTHFELLFPRRDINVKKKAEELDQEITLENIDLKLPTQNTKNETTANTTSNTNNEKTSNTTSNTNKPETTLNKEENLNLNQNVKSLPNTKQLNTTDRYSTYTEFVKNFTNHPVLVWVNKRKNESRALGNETSNNKNIGENPTMPWRKDKFLATKPEPWFKVPLKIRELYNSKIILDNPIQEQKYIQDISNIQKEHKLKTKVKNPKPENTIDQKPIENTIDPKPIENKIESKPIENPKPDQKPIESPKTVENPKPDTKPIENTIENPKPKDPKSIPRLKTHKTITDKTTNGKYSNQQWEMLSPAPEYAYKPRPNVHAMLKNSSTNTQNPTNISENTKNIFDNTKNISENTKNISDNF